MKTKEDFNPDTLFGICVDIEYGLFDNNQTPEQVAAWFKSEECRELIGPGEEYKEYLEAVEFVLNDIPDYKAVLDAWNTQK